MKVVVHCEKGFEKLFCEDHAMCYQYKTHQMHLFNQVRCEFTVDEPIILGVADGVGGNPGGHEASKYALSRLVDHASKIEQSLDDKQFHHDLLKGINEDLISYSAAIPGKKNMATTFSAIYLDSHRCELLHTGNTRICIMNSQYLKQMTTDCTTYRFLMDHGHVEEAKMCNPNEIYSCLGAGSHRSLTHIEVKNIYGNAKFPKLILLTSDGIHEHVDLDWLEDLLNNDEIDDLSKTDEMIKSALDNGSLDDKTIIMVRF